MKEVSRSSRDYAMRVCVGGSSGLVGVARIQAGRVRDYRVPLEGPQASVESWSFSGAGHQSKPGPGPWKQETRSKLENRHAGRIVTFLPDSVTFRVSGPFRHKMPISPHVFGRERPLVGIFGSNSAFVALISIEGKGHRNSGKSIRYPFSGSPTKRVKPAFSSFVHNLVFKIEPLFAGVQAEFKGH